MTDTSTCEVVTLPSGMRAIRDRASGQTMHCGTGPTVEPQEVYLRPSRLAERLLEPGAPLVLFDAGLGAASNALAAFWASDASNGTRRLEIVSFDNDLGPLRLALENENAEHFGFSQPMARTAARQLLETGRVETARTTWRLAHGDMAVCLAREAPASADIIFWDMYSARACPVLWTVEMFKNLHGACRPGATLHTTRTATTARTAMLLGGFCVGRSAGTGERSETTVASTDVHMLNDPLDARWLQRLQRSSAAFPPDVREANHAAALLQIGALPQFSVTRPVS